jgi:deoxyhypusine synthase
MKSKTNKLTTENLTDLKHQKVFSHSNSNPNKAQKANNLDDTPDIVGFDFETKLENKADFDRFIDSFSTTGFQATNIGQAIQIIKAMRRENSKIFLTFTSNIISSGLRDIITFLVKHKYVDVIVTTAGGVEEDIIKVKSSFKLGTFDASPKALYDNGIFRTGNLFVPNTRYAYLELFIDPFLKQLYADNKKILSTHEFIKELGLALNTQENKESSYIYWAAKNDIPVFSPGLVDGSIGDLLYFFKYNHKDFYLDTTGDIKKINDITLQFEKTGVICLGGGLPKHFALNANILREGADYAVFINTAQEFDGSDSGAKIAEAQTWNKIKLTALHTKIFADATTVFPLIVAATFKKEFDNKKK